MDKLWLRILWELIGVALIVVGIICICHPEITAPILVLIFGVILLLSGIADIIIYISWKRFFPGVGWFLFDGIITVLLSLFLLFHVYFTSLSMPLIFGMWIMLAGVDRIVFSCELHRLGFRGWGWMTGVGILLAMIGFFAFMDPIFGTLTMTTFTGIVLIVRGVVAIFQSVFSNRYLR